MYRAITLLNIIFLIGSGAEALATPPVIECEVRRPGWCIQREGFLIASEDMGKLRKWKLSYPILGSDPIVIYENKSCKFLRSGEPQKISESKTRAGTEIRYSLAKNSNCSLRIVLPEDSVGKQSLYKSVALTGISVCVGSQCYPKRLSEIQ